MFIHHGWNQINMIQYEKDLDITARPPTIMMILDG